MSDSLTKRVTKISLGLYGLCSCIFIAKLISKKAKISPDPINDKCNGKTFEKIYALVTYFAPKCGRSEILNIIAYICTLQIRAVYDIKV